MVGRQPDGGPAVGMYPVGEAAQQHRVVAVGLVEVALAELLDHHALLGLQFLGGDVEARHAVAFEPEGRFEVIDRQGDVEIRVVVVGESVVVAAGPLHGPVEIGDAPRAPEHEVLEQVGETRAPGVLVARPHPVEEVHGGQLRGVVAVHQDAQAVGQRMTAIRDHGFPV